MGHIDVKFVPSEKQLADALTKVPSSPSTIDLLLGPPPEPRGELNQGVCQVEVIQPPRDDTSQQGGTNNRTT